MLFALLIIQGTPKGSTAAKTEAAPLIYKQKRVQFYDDKEVSKQRSKTRWEPISNSRRSEYPSTLSTSRRACGFYLWNAVSASMYHLCNYLMRDAIFEGKGGRKFVRIEPGSLLELLYPASRHSPDKCIFCGGTYADHMTLRWSKHIYSPYDLYMDRTYSQGILQKVEVGSGTHSGGRRVAASSDETAIRHVFHSRYVHDLELLFQGLAKASDKNRMLRQKINEDPYLSDPAEMRKGLNTFYVVPLSSSKKRGIGFPLLKFARQRVLDAVDALISIEERENELLRIKAAR